MKKYVVGALFGFVLAFAASANAEVKTMIDKIVEGTFPVTVEGKKLQTDAVVIEGSTYLPVRAFGEAIGYEVKFDSDLGVSLEQKKPESDADDTINAMKERVEKFEALKKQSGDMTNEIVRLQGLLNPYEIVSHDAKPHDETYYSIKKQREELIAQRDLIDKQIEAMLK
ncbi:stalk domain-containing protein [Paenibacillus chitinolyticus]|uniref:stalk domain-containing protein n=1 Tax=Paenibacillus chitinolyticus TaxID=79263 RepID=UPI00366FEA61